MFVIAKRNAQHLVTHMSTEALRLTVSYLRQLHDLQPEAMLKCLRKIYGLKAKTRAQKLQMCANGFMFHLFYHRAFGRVKWQ